MHVVRWCRPYDVRFILQGKLGWMQDKRRKRPAGCGSMTFGSYRKGSRAEHELMDECVRHGFVVIRSAGSGKGSVCPDLLAFRKTQWLAFECKAVDSASLQLDREQYDGLVNWQETSGMTTYVAWRQTGGEWLFLRLDFFHKNNKSYAISLNDAKKIGVGIGGLFIKE